MARRVLLDTNLLVLYIVGSVNRNRIGKFKRTQRYTPACFDLLLDQIESHDVVTVSHVMSEVSNLTDLDEPELGEARARIAQFVGIVDEPHVASKHAVSEPAFARLGLTDAAIESLARSIGGVVLTDDLDLYLHLESKNLGVLYFTHLRDAEGV